MRTETILKIYNTLVLPTFLCGSENLTLNSLTKTNNWSGRNEVTETSGRLHPLWPQNKWLHTPRTTDYRHTRQDRWIQTELAFILAKNATKPSPFEIIPLQTTRKENNWKTEEALARAAVTVETERIKGSNPWCLWWWWWWWNVIFLLSYTSPTQSRNVYMQLGFIPLQHKLYSTHTDWFWRFTALGNHAAPHCIQAFRPRSGSLDGDCTFSPYFEGRFLFRDSQRYKWVIKPLTLETELVSP